MKIVLRKAMSTSNALAAALYRRSNGRIGGKARGGTPVLLLTVPGRRTGRLRTTAVSYFRRDGDYVVTGTAGGMKDDPQWIRNLKAAGAAHIQIGAEQLDVDARITSGAERDRLWQDVILAEAPVFANYEEKTGRIIPVAVLTPVTR